MDLILVEDVLRANAKQIRMAFGSIWAIQNLRLGKPSSVISVLFAIVELIVFT